MRGGIMSNFETRSFTSGEEKRKPRKRLTKRQRELRARLRSTLIKAGVPIVTLALILAGWVLVTAPERNYLNDLNALELTDQFANERVSVLQGQAFCGELGAGADPIGFERQYIAVKHFCGDFLEGFEVILTPEEQEEELLTRLREGGFGGLYASDTEAVSKAKLKCTSLENGEALKGPEYEFIAVDIYCNDFVQGFRVLDEIKVKAEFYIVGSRYGWFPSIGGSGNRCYGRGGYSDIDSGTSWTVTNPDGETLAEGELGPGKGTGSTCKFTYTFTVLEGEKKYHVSVGRRGTLKFTESDLKTPGKVVGYLG
jgi:hypothetical protein